MTVDDKGCPAPLFIEKTTFIENVFPNPTDNLLTVTVKKNIKLNEIFFIDFSGKYIKPKKFELDGNLLFINVSNLNEGIYLLNISSENDINKIKVIIER